MEHNQSLTASFKQLKIDASLPETANPNVHGASGKVLDLEGVTEQLLGEPSPRLPRGVTECVAALDEVMDGHGRMGWGKFPPPSRGSSPSGLFPRAGTIGGMSSINRERIRELIQERGTTARAVSREIGGGDTLLRDILSGKSRNARGDTLPRIAAHFGVPLEDLLIEDKDAPAPRHAITALPLLGKVQAGAWLEIDDLTQSEPEMLSAALDRRYPQARQWLREVEGDSMNARNIFPGDIAHIVELVGSGVNLNTGMIVEVTRYRAGGALREITLKEVEVADDGRMTLWPRSSNPKWQEPIRLIEEGDGEATVQVTGLLLAKITRF